MGDPRKQRRKFDTPAHPWERARIEQEKTISKQFGLKNKAEIWKMQSILKSFKVQAKDLVRRTDKEAEKQQELLMDKLIKMGLFDSPIPVEKILDIPTEDLLNRRLQSVVTQQGLAHTMKQARQFIVHGHIKVNEHVVNVPSYIVKRGEEKKITFKASSPLQDSDHPERVKEKGEEKKGKEVKVVKKATGKVDTAKEDTKPEEKVAEAPKEEKKEEAKKETPKEETKEEKKE